MEEQFENEILKHGIMTISKEREALAVLQDSLDSTFVEVVKLLLSSNGRLVISGIGKSALVGNKIVATLNSTGTAAIFMHAADAAHGDLGMVQKDDVLLCISKSGETEELTFVQQTVKQYGNKVIAMTSGKDSTLAVNADFLLYTPIHEEADPNNLAPTSSSTVQMAMGDALAISLSMMKGFTDQHFAKYHPGGTLGKQLYLKVEDIVNTSLVPVVLESANLRSVILEMTSKRLGATIVLGEDHQVKGIITDGDLRRMLSQHEETKLLIASMIMSSNPKTIQRTSMAVDALKLMREYSISQLVVLDKKTYVGLIHIHDIISKGL